MVVEVSPLNRKSTPAPASNQSNPVYSVHGHYAKRPYNVVRACIEQLSKPGEVVLDPFAGFGTTAIEALWTRRKAISMDINPVSVFITRSILSPATPEEIENYRQSVERLVTDAGPRISDLYSTRCQNCGSPVELARTVFDATTDAEDFRERKYEPRELAFKESCCKAKKRKATKKDVSDFRASQRTKPPYWYPQAPLIVNSRVNVREGMTVADLFTRRNLTALSILHKVIWDLSSGVESNLLKFTFSAILRSASLLVHEQGGGWSNNFTVPKSGLAERNVLDMFVRKSKEVVKCKREVNRWVGDWYREAKDPADLEGDSTIFLRKWDATRVTELVGEKSVPYIHVDPPYGDNIPYLELFLPHLAWLGLDAELTKSDWHNEIVITDARDYRDKDATRYRKLMVKSFQEMGSVLMDGRWATVWFACIDEEIWRALADAVRAAGLDQRESYLVARTAQQKSYSIKARAARNPLATVLTEDLLLHAVKSGAPRAVIEVPRANAAAIFLEAAEATIRRKGSASTGEIYLEFANLCLERYGNPPPDLQYEEVLQGDGRFRREEVSRQNGTKETHWKLNGFRHRGTLSYYVEEESGKK